MSFVTTQPEALAYAAAKLQTIGSAVAAESAAAAAPTTEVIPAAADEVSALQATIFGAYGSLYQSVNAQAAAVHQLFVHTLGASAGSYAATESSNSATTASPLAQRVSGLLGSAASTDPPSGALANIANIGTGNWDSAASDLLGMCGGGLLPGANETGDAAFETAGATAGATTGSEPTVLQVTAESSGSGAVPMWGTVGQPALVNSLSAPSWPAGAAPAASPGAVMTAGWTGPASQSAPATTMPAAMPLATTAGKTGGMGVPRYGVKPTVMGRPTVA